MAPKVKSIEDGAPLPSFYKSSPGGSIEERSLRADVSCETLVIGGGVTGGSTAYHLAARGHDVALLERGAIGEGGTGRAFGQVVAFGKHSERYLLKTHGTERGERLIAWLASGPQRVFDLIERHAIPCDMHRTGLLFAAHFDGAVPALQKRVADLAHRGEDVAYLGREQTAALVGADFYPGAMLDRRAGSINPLAFATGLADAAQSFGARIFTHSSATALRREAGRWVVTTPEGRVRAKSVVFCTNAYSGTLWPKLSASIVPTRAYQLVSKPLGENVRHSILPERQALTDTRRLFSGIRVLNDGRMHLSVNGPPFDLGGEPDRAMASERVSSLFPQLDGVEWDGGWTGWVAVNLPQEPKLHRLEDRAWAAIGYSGRGLAFGTLMGEQIALRITEPNSPNIVYPLSPLRPLIGQRFGPWVVNAYLKYCAYRDAQELQKTKQQTIALRTN